MGYMHINNLYKDQRLLMFKELYALEKVHGTSAHVKWSKDQPMDFYSGGAPLDLFTRIFDHAVLQAAFEKLGHSEVTVFGEAYGGKMQGMKETYGDKLAFIAFDVQVGTSWLTVPDMEQVAMALGFEVVPWCKTSTDLAALDALRDAFSEVAVRRGCGADKHREGVVLRPLIELHTNSGERLIAKHKGAAFEERVHPPKLTDDPEKQAVKAIGDAVAQEWVTEMRLSHVLDKLQAAGVDVADIRSTPQVLAAMEEDVLREAASEIVPSKETKNAIRRRAAQLFTARVKTIIQ